MRPTAVPILGLSPTPSEPSPAHGRRSFAEPSVAAAGPAQNCVRLPSLAGGANGALSLRVPSSSADGLQRLGARSGPVAQVARGRSTPLHTTHLRPAPLALAGTSRRVPASHATPTTPTKEQA